MNKKTLLYGIFYLYINFIVAEKFLSALLLQIISLFFAEIEA